MTARGDVLSVIEAAYRPTSSMQAWLEAVTSAFTTLRRTWVHYLPGIANALDQFDIADGTFVNATDPTFCGALLGAFGESARLSPRTRNLWRRVAAHVAAGLRLQQQVRALANPEDLVDGAEAILSPQGRVEHATGAAGEEESRLALQEGLVRIAAARRARRDPIQAAELWTGLCAGRWSLVEHFERDGRRFFLACRNDPQLASLRALTARERQVCTYAAMGYSNKLIAYSLGVSISSVAKHLSRARSKLGGATTLEALAGLIPPADSSSEAPSMRSPN